MTFDESIEPPNTYRPYFGNSLELCVSYQSIEELRYVS